MMAFINLTSLRSAALKLKLQPIVRHLSTKKKIFQNVPAAVQKYHEDIGGLLFREQLDIATRSFYKKNGHFRTIHQTAVYHDDYKIVKTPPFAESVTEGDVKWQKAVGDFVNEDQVVGEIETDKTSIPIHAPASGVIESLLAEDGSKVVAGQDLLKLRLTKDKGAAAAAKPAQASDKPSKPAEIAEKPAKAAESAKSSTAGPVPSSPPPAPSVPKGPVSSTPSSYIKPTPAVSSPQSTAAKTSTGAPTIGSGTRNEQRVKMSRMRLRIAQRLKEAQNTCAMLTTFNEIDMTNISEMRTKFKDEFQKKHTVKLGFMSAFVKASAYALQDQPVVNAVIDDQEIVYRDYVDISVAVATPKGLVVPVLRNVETMNYAQIEKALGELGEKARANSLAIEDMDGGTFTISNGGVFGSMFGTPIINPPQSAILGMHAIIDRPVVIKGKIEIRPMMYVALTYDHRLIDGREAVTFLRKIKAAVEDPRIIMMDL